MTGPDLEPIRTWEQVFECMQNIVENPTVNTELAKALTVNLRAETGSTVLAIRRGRA